MIKKNNFQTVKRLIKTEQADLWVLPELFNTGYLFESKHELNNLAENIPNGETTYFLIELANSFKTTIVAGLAEKNNNDFYNSAIAVNKNGLVGLYRKIHLFDSEKKWFKPGDLPFQVWNIGLAKIGMMICFDWIFPESTRTLALKGADIICHPTNLVMPYCQNAMVTRCLENRIFAITANRIGMEQRGNQQLKFTGASQITNYNGDILYRGSTDNEEVSVVEINPHLTRDKKINENNDLFGDRRPEMYEVKP